MNFNESEINTIGYAISRALSEFDSNTDSDERVLVEALRNLEDKVTEAMTAW